jgi:LysR family transcriptional regulator for metE and metH
MDVEVRHLRLVSAVADLGSLTKAGERLHLTQSALSHQLRDIEARLGTPLFLRIGKRLVLTPAGTRLLASAREVLDRLQQAEDDIRQLGRDRAGVLRITTECYTCYHWLPPLLTRYRRRFPRVEVRIDVDATSRPMPSLFDGKIDLAIVSSPVSDRRLVLRPIFQDELLVVVSPAHRLAGRPRVRLADLRDETMFVYPPKEECRYLQQVLAPAGVPARVEEMQLTEAITELVKANFGFSVLARWAVQPLLDAGALVALPIAPRGLRRHWSAAMPKALAAVDYVQEFVALLTRHAPARPGVNAASSAGISRNGARRADRRAS